MLPHLFPVQRDLSLEAGGPGGSVLFGIAINIISRDIGYETGVLCR